MLRCVSSLSIAVVAASLSMPLALKAETLADALASVQVTNAKLEAERARARGDSERVNQARSGFLPTVQATGDYGLMRSRNLSSGTNSSTSPHSVGVSFSQPIFNGFKNLSDYRKSQDETLASYASLTTAEQQTMLYGAQAFMKVVRDRKILAMRSDNLHNLRVAFEQSQGRFKAGDMTRTSVDQARSRMNEAEADVASSRADVADSEAFYRYIIGRTPGRLSVPAMSKVQMPCNLQDALVVGENENPTLQGARHTANAATHGITSAKAAFYPTVSLDGSIKRGYDEARIQGTASQDAQIGLKVGVPIFNGGLDKARLTQARMVKTQKDAEVEDARNLVHRQVSSAWDGLKATKLRKYAAQKRVAAVEAAQKGLMIEYGAGQIALINVLDGRREVINAKVTYAMAENDEIIAHFTLLSALGHLDMRVAEDLSAGRTYRAGASCGSRPIMGESRALIASGPIQVLGAKQPNTMVATGTQSNGNNQAVAAPLEPVSPAPLAYAAPAPRGAFATLMAFGKKGDVATTASLRTAQPVVQPPVQPHMQPLVQPVTQALATPKPVATKTQETVHVPMHTQVPVTPPQYAVAPVQAPARGAIGALMSLTNRGRIDPAPTAALRQDEPVAGALPRPLVR